MFFLAKYGTQTTFQFPMIKRGAVDFAQTADWTPAATDAAISKDAGNLVDTTNTVAITGGTPTRGAALWKLTLTATELQCAVAEVQIVDATTKAVEDQCIIILTYGNASAAIPLDLSINQTGDSYAKVDTEIGDIQNRLPAALVSGRMDASIGAVAANAIADAGVAADMDAYHAKVWVIREGTNTDHYAVIFFKNGQPVTTGITSPTIQVIKASDGTDLIASGALTEVSSLGIYKKDESTNKLTAGAIYFAKVTASIDSATRTWWQQIGRDS